MTYCKNYCEEKGISTSKLNEAQRTLHYIAENMKMAKSISEEGYTHFQIAIKALEQEPISETDIILTREEYGELVSSEFDNGYAKGFREALEQEEPILDK